MRYRLTEIDQWAVVHDVVWHLQARYPRSVSWAPELFNAAERQRVELQLERLIRQKLDHLNQGSPGAVDNPPVSRPRTRKELIRLNLPARGYDSDLRELGEASSGLLANRPSGDGEYRCEVSGTGNVWYLSRSGYVLAVHEHPAVAWASYLSALYDASEGRRAVAPDPHKITPLDLFVDDVASWIPRAQR
ncbi:unnamed protein product [Peniophora sp. CBMAI 1063]|nr:unnamed protein product [Peniophora sp. CBMAI 1063]